MAQCVERTHANQIVVGSNPIRVVCVFLCYLLKTFVNSYKLHIIDNFHIDCYFECAIV